MAAQVIIVARVIMVGLVLDTDFNDHFMAIKESLVEIDFEDKEDIEIGKGKIVQKGQKIAVLAYGTIIEEAFKASKEIEEEFGFEITIADARFAKPFDESLIKDLAKTHETLITIEEGVIGGFGSAVGNFLQNEGILDDGKLKFRSLFMKDEFFEQDDVAVLRKKAGISSDDIVKLVLSS